MRILNGHSVKVAQKPFQTLGHIFAKSKDPVTIEQWTDAIYSIPCNDCDNVFGTCLKEHQKAVFFCKKEESVLSEHTCLSVQLGGISLKLPPLIGVTTSAFVWKLGILTLPMLLWIVMKAAYFLMPIHTSWEKRQLISDRIEGPLVAAFRSPLMKVLERSVET